MRPLAASSSLQRVWNFSAGPAALPLSVLGRVRDELLSYRKTGLSVLEMSHRSKAFEAIRDAVEEKLRKLLDLPSNYEVLFLQGGGSLQFAMVPLNLAQKGLPVEVLHTGYWTKKAIAELEKIAPYRIGASSAPPHLKLPPLPKKELGMNASYLYLCSNNTIEGTQWRSLPKSAQAPLVVDCSSDFLTRPMTFPPQGLYFAGAQKNAGAAGLTIVLLSRELAERAPTSLPTLLQYRTHIAHRSLYHTPPTFALYLCGLMLDWIDEQGGMKKIEREVEQKASLLYQALDQSSLYTPLVPAPDRSFMNICFRVKNGHEALEQKLLEEAEQNGFVGLKGHRAAGGLRASLYLGVPKEAVEALVDFLQAFEKKHG